MRTRRLTPQHEVALQCLANADMQTGFYSTAERIAITLGKSTAAAQQLIDELVAWGVVEPKEGLRCN